jgi:hypothetical protein
MGLATFIATVATVTNASTSRLLQPVNVTLESSVHDTSNARNQLRPAAILNRTPHVMNYSHITKYRSLPDRVQGFAGGSQRERDQWGDPDVDGKIIQ